LGAQPKSGKIVGTHTKVPFEGAAVCVAAAGELTSGGF
jgi:hypothetical protein